MIEYLQEEHVEFRLPLFTAPLTEPIIVIDAARVAPYFDNVRDTRNLLAGARGADFAAKVANQVHDVYHAKAGSPSIVEHVPSDIPVVSAFKRLPQMIAANEIRGQGGKVHLHIGTPDSQDKKYNFLQVPNASDIREQAIEMRKSLGAGGKDKLQRILTTVILDGSHPDSMELLEYAREIKRIYPKALLNFKISAQSITENFNRLLYTAKKGLSVDQISTLMQTFPWYNDFGIDLYIGSPLDEARLRNISNFVNQLEAEKIAPVTRKPRVSTLYIGGIGGYGEEIPHKPMLDLFANIWNKFPEMAIEVEHGRGAVERIAYAIFPHANIATIAQYLPDYERQPDKLKTEEVQISNQPYTVVHNVGYLDTQRPEMKVDVLL